MAKSSVRAARGLWTPGCKGHSQIANGWSPTPKVVTATIVLVRNRIIALMEALGPPLRDKRYGRFHGALIAARAYSVLDKILVKCSILVKKKDETGVHASEAFRR